MRRTAFALLVVLSTAGYAGATASKEVAPFAYTFQFTSVTLTGIFTKGDATATTSLRLSTLPKSQTLRWYGKKGSGAGTAATVLMSPGRTRMPVSILLATAP